MHEFWSPQVVLVVKNSPANAGDIRDAGLIPESGRFPGIGNGNPFQYPCLKIPWTEEPKDYSLFSSLAHFFDWVIYFSGVELEELLVYF